MERKLARIVKRSGFFKKIAPDYVAPDNQEPNLDTSPEVKPEPEPEVKMKTIYYAVERAFMVPERFTDEQIDRIIQETLLGADNYIWSEEPGLFFEK